MRRYQCRQDPAGDTAGKPSTNRQRRVRLPQTSASERTTSQVAALAEGVGRAGLAFPAMARRTLGVVAASIRLMLATAAVLLVVLALAPGAGGLQSRGAVLKPTPVGSGQCSYYPWTTGAAAAQVAESGTTCTVAERVLQGSNSARGATYHADGFSCTSTREGAKSAWASAWGGTYYAYSCVSSGKQVAFNWGADYTYAGGGATLTTVPDSSNGHLLPSPVGSGQCLAGDKNGAVYAQVAISGVSCFVAEPVMAGADAAKGASYSSHGFSCTARTEGRHTSWSAAWGGTYHVYNCAKGSEQIAFTWGTDYTY